MSSLVEDVKATVSMRAVAERYGLEVSRGGFIACPFHAEKTPSLKVYEQPGRGYCCFGCGSKGSVIDFVMALLNLPFPAATVRLAADFGIITQERAPADAMAARAARTERARQLARYDKLVARWRWLSSIRWILAPQGPEEDWWPAWCNALKELPGLEDEIEQMEVAGFGK